ncbi:hypothetical protein TWF694_010631 [Orbilia ellipsospora]|uniref:LAGLIDADG endonuclease n=1 Tax=Orbilia ellipsospora TaxID=2528407 RepID=A0AAV9XBU7_9PEZI
MTTMWGGYGQLVHSFGLFGDHVVSLKIIDHEGTIKGIARTNHEDLFFGIIGTSPGNFAVITHFTTKAHRDQDHAGSRRLKALYFYNPTTLERLLDTLVKMSANNEFPRNYDYYIVVLSSSNKLLD